MKKSYHYLLGLIITAFFVVKAPICCANSISFDVTLNTSGLINHPAGPFYIDFQLNDGSGNFAVGVNTTMISNFSGASLSGTPQRFGNVTGLLADTKGITLMDDAHFINEFFQPFTPGQSLKFTVSLTTNVDPGFVPDAFSFSILDSLLSPIPTTNFADAFIFVNINSANLTPADLQGSIFAGDPTRSPLAGGDAISIGSPRVPGVPGVPDTGSSIIILLIGIGTVWCYEVVFLRRDQRKCAIIL